jgi:N-acetylglucosamine-6-phosphate deacetylase
MMAFDQGVGAVTHLFNAMSPLHHRSPGLAGAAMAHDSVMASIIPDGLHVHHAMVKMASRVMKGRLFAITDAVTETTTGPYRHQLATDHYTSGGILSGSALNMITACRNLVKKAGVPFDEAIRMCSLYPAKLLKKEQEFGRISQGYRTSLLVLDEELHVKNIFDP